jgi:hypothetical protein
MKNVLIYLAVQNERAPRHGTKRIVPPLPRMQCWKSPTAAGYVTESPQVTMPFGFRNLPNNK